MKYKYHYDVRTCKVFNVVFSCKFIGENGEMKKQTNSYLITVQGR